MSAALVIQNASDDYSRFQLEREGRGIVARVEWLDDGAIEAAKLFAASPAMLHALRMSANAAGDEEIQEANELVMDAILLATGERFQCWEHSEVQA